MTASVSKAIADAWDELDSDPGLTVGIITGSGGNFCAGMDLKRFLAGERVSIPGRGFGGTTESPPAKPIIAAVEGYALAGGFELMLACDMAVAGEGARFGLPEVKRGLMAIAGGLLRLPDRIPRAVALEIILTGEMLTATRAAEVGLVNRVVSDGEALFYARELAQVISANAPMAVVSSKRVVVESRGWPESERYERQSEISRPIFASKDAIEGATAFREKRSAIWSGQ